MNETMVVPKWFWVVSGLALIWNLLGLAAFFNQLTMDPSSLPAAQQEFYETQPVWAVIGFAVAVIGGTLGCIALLMRKDWAFLMLVICIVGILVQNLHSIVIGDGIEVFGQGALVLPAMTLLIAIGLAWFAWFSRKKGWIA